MRVGSMFTPLCLSGVALLALGFAVPAPGQPAAAAADMVLVPAGEFTMGSAGKAIDEDKAEAPEHKLALPAFLIDKCEVTTAQYAQFLNAVKATKDDGTTTSFEVILRLDSPVEVEYLYQGGILQYVLRQLAKKS